MRRQLSSLEDGVGDLRERSARLTKARSRLRARGRARVRTRGSRAQR
jgi:hypothetical protein